MRLRVLGLACFLIGLTGVQARGLEIAVPPDRFAGPGEFVTFVFRLTAEQPVEAEVEAETDRGWPVLRQPGTVRLEAGRSTPVVATVEVPQDAAAFSEERVTLRVTTPVGQFERAVLLTVTERVAFDLEVPREVTIGVEDLTVSASNLGNAADAVAVELRRGAEVLERREFVLAPGASQDLTFALREDGSHTVVLTSGRGTEVRRGVRVLRFGTPDPEPFVLATALRVFGDTEGGWGSTFTAEGALSDFAVLDARVDAPAWRRSYAEVTLDAGSLRVGAGGSDTFGLRLPVAFGVTGTLRRDAWALASGVGHIADDRFAGVVAASWNAPDLSLAGGVGVLEGMPLVAVRADRVGPKLRTTANARRARGATDAGLSLEARDGQGTAELELRATGLDAGGGQIDLRVRYGTEADTLYGDVSWSLDGDAPREGRLGASAVLVSPWVGGLRLDLQGGSQESLIQVSHRGDLGGGWRVSNAAGMRWDDAGFGVTFDASWSRVGSAYLAADTRLVYRPATGDVEGLLGVRAEADRAPWSVNASGAWDLGSRSLGADAAVAWQHGPWGLEVGASGRYALSPDVVEPWSVSVSLAGAYAVAVPVGAGLSEAFGGRRVGVLEGRVRVHDEGLHGVVVEVGRYRVVTDEAGAFRLELPPGRYGWTVVVGSVPIAVSLVEEARGEVEVRLREVTALEIRAARTTALAGRVLEDGDGDGVADEPWKGVRARLVVTDAEGLRRTVVSDADGAFEVRGLVPGETSVTVLEVPGGATVVGVETTRFVLEAGVPAEVRFLVRPPVVTVQAFTPDALRVRDVSLEADRVPPESAPLVRVAVQGEPSTVVLTLPEGVEVEMAPDDGVWVGRVPVAAGSPVGVLAFSVVARGPAGEAVRRAQLIVDPVAPALEVTSDAPVRAGGLLTVRVRAFLEARFVTLVQPFGEDVAMVEEEPGRWIGTLTVPAATSDDVYELVVRVASGGREIVETVRVRVLAP